MRIAVGGFAHETSSFGNTLVTLEEAIQSITLAEYMDRWYPGRRSFYGGFYAAAKDRGVHIVPTRDTYRLPSGPFTREAFEFCRDRLVETIIPCESPGIQTANLNLLPFKNADMTYYPLQNAKWEG